MVKACLWSLALIVVVAGCGKASPGSVPPLRGTAYEAAATGNLRDVMRYDRDGFNMNLPDESGMTPLHHAAANGHADVVTWLVKNTNAKLDIKDKQGRTPRECAQESGKADVLAAIDEASAARP